MNNNQHQPPKILTRTKVVQANGADLTVFVMTWPNTFELLKLLSEHAKSFISEGGKLTFDPAKLADLIIGTQQLAEFLICHSTEIDKDALARMHFYEVLDLLDAALEINLDPEIIGRAKKVAGRLGQALGVKLTAGPATKESLTPSTSSSGKDTPSILS